MKIKKKIKKILKSAVIGAAMLGLAGTAQATEYNLNIYGASAQHKFWNAAAPSFLTDVMGCTGTAQSSKDKKNGITRGTGCDVDGVGGNDDTVYIRYSSKASYDGIRAVKGEDPSAQCPSEGPEFRLMVDEATCAWTGPKDNSCSTKCVDVTLGASDVAGSSLKQSTSGWEDGHKDFPSGPMISPSFTGFDTTGLAYANPVVVPFGFYANNSVTKTRCVSPRPDSPDGIHKAYPHWGWQCVPDANGNSADCIGYYKCPNDTKKCLGGVRIDLDCVDPEDCPDVALADTECLAMPIDNFTRLMAILLFKNDSITNWDQFGPWYPSLDIVKCMRHAGSGTHATLDLAVMRRDGVPHATSNPIAPGMIWHYVSSSDLLDCVEFYPGAVGYADADKLMGTDDTGNIHILKYQGVEPVREKIKNCEYNFWATQWVYWDAAEVEGLGLTNLVNDLMTYAGDPLNLTYENIGYRADFWAAQSEMSCKKDNDFAYPRWNP